MYPKLSADERFKMVIQTFVNDDELQRKKLVKSCPRVTYYESDHAYTERIETSRDIVTVFIIQLLEYDKVISIMKILKGVNKKVDVLNNEVKTIKEIKAFILAFETFCNEHVGIDSKDMIQAWYGYDGTYVDKIVRVKEFLNFYPVKPDMQLKDIWMEKVFINAWNSRLGPYSN